MTRRPAGTGIAREVTLRHSRRPRRRWTGSGPFGLRHHGRRKRVGQQVTLGGQVRQQQLRRTDTVAAHVVSQRIRPHPGSIRAESRTDRRSMSEIADHLAAQLRVDQTGNIGREEGPPIGGHRVKYLSHLHPAHHPLGRTATGPADSAASAPSATAPTRPADAPHRVVQAQKGALGSAGRPPHRTARTPLPVRSRPQHSPSVSSTTAEAHQDVVHRSGESAKGRSGVAQRRGVDPHRTHASLPVSTRHRRQQAGDVERSVRSKWRPQTAVAPPRRWLRPVPGRRSPPGERPRRSARPALGNPPDRAGSSMDSRHELTVRVHRRRDPTRRPSGRSRSRRPRRPASGPNARPARRIRRAPPRRWPACPSACDRP